MARLRLPPADGLYVGAARVAKRPPQTYHPGDMDARAIKVAAGQVTARLMGEADATLAGLEALITSAGRQQVRLLVLPECAYPAYLLGSVAAYRGGGHRSSDAFVQWLARHAARHRMHIVCGLVEDTSAALFNAAVLIDDRGRPVGWTRKRFLWHADHDWFAAGGEIRAFQTELGRIGIVICAETRVPELLATLAADGVELIAMPTCWVNSARAPGRFENPQISFLIEARAREFAVPFVCADKSGLEMPGVGYVGSSRIVGPDGTLLAEAPPTGDALVTATVSPCRACGPALSDRLRRRLLAEAPPVRPPAAPPRPLTLAAAPARTARQNIQEGKESSWCQSLRGRGVGMLVTAGAALPPPVAAEAAAGGLLLPSAAPGGDIVQAGPARVAFVRGEEIGSFGPPRAAALGGADLIVCIEPPRDLPLLRTRAVENRVFLAAIGESWAAIVGPDGAILAQGGSSRQDEAVARIDLAAAGDKCVAPRTDIFAQRQVATYRF